MAEPQRTSDQRELRTIIRNPRDRREVDRRRTYITPPTASADSQERITYRSPTAFAQNNQNTDSLHETTSDQFNTEQYAGGIPTRPAGISNVQVDYRTRSNPTPTNSNVRPLDRNVRKQQNQIATETQRPTQPATQNKHKKRKQLNPVKRVISVAYRTAARASLMSAYTWTGFIWAFIQIPLAVIGFIAIGILIGIENFIGSGTTQTLFDAFMRMMGVEWDFYLVAFLCYLIVVFSCYIQVFGVWMQTTFSGMKPLDGRGSGFKYGTFLLAVMMYWIPGANLFPWVWLWIFAIGVNPR